MMRDSVISLCKSLSISLGCLTSFVVTGISIPALVQNTETVSALQVAAPNIITGTTNGVMRSTDGGASWILVLKTDTFGVTPTSRRPAPVTALARNPRNPREVFAGTNQGGAWKSSDNGETWTPVNTGLPQIVLPETVNPVFLTSVYGLVFDANDPTSIYAATDDGIYKSKDDGAHWEQSSAGLPTTILSTVPGRKSFAMILCVQADTKNSKVVYAGGDGVFQSTDGGQSWSKVGQGVPAGTWIKGLAVDSMSIYALSEHAIFSSVRGSSHWVQTGSGLPANARLNGMAVVSDHAAIYVATSMGVFKSTDRAATWADMSKGLPPNASVSSIASDSGGSSHIYLGTSNGVFVSTDEGMNWAMLPVGGGTAPGTQHNAKPGLWQLKRH